MRVPMLSRVFVGDEIRIPQLCGDYFMSHEIKDPVIKQPGFQWKVGECVVFFDRGSLSGE